jgi:hypothetical protein
MEAPAMQKLPIYTSSASWHEVAGDKIDLTYDLGEYLSKKIDLNSFGSDLYRIWFVALIMLPQDRVHTNEIVLKRKTKTLEVFWKMDYDRAQAASLVEFREYLLDFFLETMKHAFEVKKIKGFDQDKFLVALQKEGKTWLKNAPEAVSA